MVGSRAGSGSIRCCRCSPSTLVAVSDLLLAFVATAVVCSPFEHGGALTSQESALLLTGLQTLVDSSVLAEVEDVARVCWAQWMRVFWIGMVKIGGGFSEAAVSCLTLVKACYPSDASLRGAPGRPRTSRR